MEGREVLPLFEALAKLQPHQIAVSTMSDKYIALMNSQSEKDEPALNIGEFVNYSIHIDHNNIFRFYESDRPIILAYTPDKSKESHFVIVTRAEYKELFESEK